MTLSDYLSDLGWQHGIEPSEGLLSPDGTFWMCGYEQHALLAQDIRDYYGGDAPDEEQWLKIGFAVRVELGVPGSEHYMWYIAGGCNDTYTPAQIATLEQMALCQDPTGFGKFAGQRVVGYNKRHGI
jgi:hypothetical protein